jgi:hypothetical protein
MDGVYHAKKHVRTLDKIGGMAVAESGADSGSAIAGLR